MNDLIRALLKKIICVVPLTQLPSHSGKPWSSSGLIVMKISVMLK